jgi:multiple sugar transport system substrate-binding protein
MAMNRRDVLKAGGALAGLATAERLGWARAWAEEQPFKPEKGARLRFLRWGKFLDAEDKATTANIEAFAKATGVDVAIQNEWQDDIQTKAAVAANTGAGPDIVWALHTTPHLFPDKLVDLSDVADYLGGKYGGWYPVVEQYGRHDGRWIGIPSIVIGNVPTYRMSMVKAAGFDAFPADTDGFLKLCQNLKKNGTPAGFTFGRAPNDGNVWCHWLVWAFGGRMIDENNRVVIAGKETAQALDYARAVYETMIPGTVSWSDASNNSAFLSGQISATGNSVSIYGKALQDKMEMAQDINHAFFPVGPVGKPAEMHLFYPLMVFNYTKFPNAAKAFVAFMMEAPQYDQLLERSIGYITQTLRAYEANPVWKGDPKISLFRDCTARARSIAYAGQLGTPTAAVLADYVLVDMVQEAVTGQSSPADAMAKAQRRAERFYKS